MSRRYRRPWTPRLERLSPPVSSLAWINLAISHNGQAVKLKPCAPSATAQPELLHYGRGHLARSK